MQSMYQDEPTRISNIGGNAGARSHVQQHRELKTQINRVHDPITQRLPPEILSYIFQLCVLCNSEGTWNLSEDEAAAPFILGAVCQHWRQIVWSTPQLWTSIRVDFGAPDLESCYDMVQQRLARSGGLPLSLYIHIPHSAEDLESLASPDTANSLIELINLHSSRWSLLDLDIPAPLFSCFCGNSHSTSASILRALRLQSYRRYSGGDGKFSIQNLKPRPEIIFLSDFLIEAVDIVWDNVIQVELVGHKLEDCLELFKRALRLKNGKLREIGGRKASAPPYTILHPHLKVLYVSSSFSMSPFFTKVTFPALEEFSYNSLLGAGRLPAVILISLFNRSSSRLRRFQIDDSSICDENLIPLLEAIPSLRRLEINPRSTNYSPDNLFDRLARTSLSNDSHGKQTNGNFLPELQFFRFRTEHKISFQFVPDIFGPLSELDNPRRRPLHTVQMHFDRMAAKNTRIYIDKEIIPRLVTVLEARLNLEILHLDNPNQLESPDLIRASMEYHGMADE